MYYSGTCLFCQAESRKSIRVIYHFRQKMLTNFLALPRPWCYTVLNYVYLSPVRRIHIRFDFTI